MKRVLSVLGLCALMICSGLFDVGGAELSGALRVHQESDTAANAKIKATNSALRQVFFDVVSGYSDKDALRQLLNDTKDSDLINFVTSSSVTNERISSTAYSANITWNFDNDLIKDWLTKNEIQNWIPAVESGEKFTISVVLPNGLNDWAELNRIAHENNIEIETKTISGNNVIAKLPVSYRTKFTIAVRSAGWKYTDDGGILQIWK